MDEEEIVDNKPDIEEACKPNCSKIWSTYEQCITRVKKDTSGEAHCTGQYLDFWACIDKCAVPKIFSSLK